MKISLNVNGEHHELDEVAPWESLLFVLRDRLGRYGSKNACEQGECGSCSVMVDGELICSCLMPVGQAQDRTVITIEGLESNPVATVVRQCMRESGGVQCGFCTPGFVVAATAILTSNVDAKSEEVKEGLSGNLCRCTGYSKILEAISSAGGRLTASMVTVNE